MQLTAVNLALWMSVGGAAGGLIGTACNQPAIGVAVGIAASVVGCGLLTLVRGPTGGD